MNDLAREKISVERYLEIMGAISMKVNIFTENKSRDVIVSKNIFPGKERAISCCPLHTGWPPFICPEPGPGGRPGLSRLDVRDEAVQPGLKQA